MNHFPRMMGLLDDTDTINAVLSQLAEEGSVEPMIEPIDEPNAHPLDWAEIVGLWDEIAGNMYTEPTTMVDENGFVWYVS